MSAYCKEGEGRREGGGRYLSVASDTPPRAPGVSSAILPSLSLDECNTFRCKLPRRLDCDITVYVGL